MGFVPAFILRNVVYAEVRAQVDDSLTRFDQVANDIHRNAVWQRRKCEIDARNQLLDPDFLQPKITLMNKGGVDIAQTLPHVMF
jgi:hypothetical protein